MVHRQKHFGSPLQSALWEAYCFQWSHWCSLCQYWCRYFINTKYTAAIRQINAARWFQCKASPLKKMVVNTVKITSVITSWMTFSCINENGPPLPIKPMRLAGIWQEYSFNITHLPMTGKHIIFALNIMQLPWTIKKQ